MIHKFRAYDTATKRWLAEGFTILGEVNCFAIIEQALMEQPMGKTTLERIGDVVITLQSPWHDRNGKQIYDGDILEIVDDKGVTIRVTCQYGEHVRTMDSGYAVAIAGFAFVRLYDNHPAFPILNNYAGKSDLEIIEIIGNRFENPELI